MKLSNILWCTFFSTWISNKSVNPGNFTHPYFAAEADFAEEANQQINENVKIDST